MEATSIRATGRQLCRVAPSSRSQTWCPGASVDCEKSPCSRVIKHGSWRLLHYSTRHMLSTFQSLVCFILVSVLQGRYNYLQIGKQVCKDKSPFWHHTIGKCQNQDLDPCGLVAVFYGPQQFLPLPTWNVWLGHTAWRRRLSHGSFFIRKTNFM